MDCQNMLSTNQVGSTAKLVENLEQYITAQSAECQAAVQQIMMPMLAAAESRQASLSQRIVTDRLQDEGTAGLPSHHPLHWFQSQLEFQIQGLLEYPNLELAQAGLKEVLDELKPQLVALIGAYQVNVSEYLDQEVLGLQQTFAKDFAGQFQSRSVVVSEYINSYVRLPRLKMKSVDRFRYTFNGKRWESPALITAGQRNSAPWYQFGLGKKDCNFYQVSVPSVASMVDESVVRAFRHMREQISDYIELELREGIEKLAASLT
jgi:hypothetical protein